MYSPSSIRSMVHSPSDETTNSVAFLPSPSADFLPSPSSPSLAFLPSRPKTRAKEVEGKIDSVDRNASSSVKNFDDEDDDDDDDDDVNDDDDDDVDDDDGFDAFE